MPRIYVSWWGLMQHTMQPLWCIYASSLPVHPMTALIHHSELPFLQNAGFRKGDHVDQVSLHSAFTKSNKGKKSSKAKRRKRPGRCRSAGSQLEDTGKGLKSDVGVQQVGQSPGPERVRSATNVTGTQWQRTGLTHNICKCKIFTPKGTDALVSSPSVSRLGIYVQQRGPPEP